VLKKREENFILAKGIGFGSELVSESVARESYP
jgi:hypothetical protein